MSYAVTPDGIPLGWRDDLEDRTTLHLTAKRFAFRAPVNPPRTVDPRSWLRIEYQGQMGSCAGHAASTCAEICNWFRTSGRVIQLSRMWCYLMGQQMCNLFGSDAGCTITGAVAAMSEFGVPREETFPYPPMYITTIPAAAAQEAGPHRINSHTVMRSYDDVFSLLASMIGAVQIGIQWTSSLHTDRTGVIDFVNGPILGAHSLALVGYSDRLDAQQRPYIIMANSHGTGWGNNGCAEVAPAVIDAWIQSPGTEFIGVSDLSAYDENTNRSIDWGPIFE
jgi:hypothetical protein